jgi:selenide,water dikinase
MQNGAPILKDVVLVGGGHSHVLLMRMWAMQPIPGVRLTLISQSVDTPYSGMLPGLIAGHYSEQDVHIDLARLCSWANVRFIEASATGIDLHNKQIFVEEHLTPQSTQRNQPRPTIAFDLLSLDTGSTPELSVDGSADFSVPVKPVYNFYTRWQALYERVSAEQQSAKNDSLIRVGVVGSGAGGFELVMAMQHALAQTTAEFHWFVRGTRSISGRPVSVSDAAFAAARQAGVHIHTEFDVIDVQVDAVVARDGRVVALDEIVWCAAAKAPAWPAEAGLQTDDRGFVLTNEHLQSVSHEYVFATGDIGTQQKTPSAKAGVFAVRQAPVLFQNIRRYLLSKQLKTYKPQRDFLSLMATGGKSAIASRGPFCITGPAMWQLKNHIDQKFMNQFRLLPAMQFGRYSLQIPAALLSESSITPDEADASHMRCKGCGAKVGASILDFVLSQLTPIEGDGIVCGLEQASDAAIINVGDHALVQSVDQISSLCSDPYTFARIATVHALSDVLAQGAKAHSAQVLVTIPYADKSVVKRDLQQLMSGVVDSLNENACVLVGGHTSEGPELQLGFVINGVQVPQSAIPVTVGDKIILSKPIGTGVVLAGHMQQLAYGVDVHTMLQSMQLSNAQAAQQLRAVGCKAMTDVTGFGLLGHLRQLLKGQALGAELRTDNITTYRGALALAEQGVQSTLLAQNQQITSECQFNSALNPIWQNLLCDPQTSGGLLAIVPAEAVNDVMAQLHAQEGSAPSVVGSVVQSSGIVVN